MQCFNVVSTVCIPMQCSDFLLTIMYNGEKSPVVIGSGKEKREKVGVGEKIRLNIRSWRQARPSPAAES